MRFLSLVLLTLLVSVNVQAKRIAVASPQEAPRQAAQEFYHWVLTTRVAGLPSSREMVKLKPLLSPQLVELIEKVRVVEQRCIRNTPKGDKPPVIEGALLVGNYEGADEVVMGEPRVQSGEATVSSLLLMIDSRFPKASLSRTFSWNDQLVLRFNGSRWQVVDINFEQKKSLVQNLTEYIAENKSCSQ